EGDRRGGAEAVAAAGPAMGGRGGRETRRGARVPPATIEHPVWVDKVVPLASEQTGVFYPLVRRGTYVEQGMKVGYVTDYLGKVIFEARAPAPGIVLYICAVPSMTKDATIANIGVVAR